MTNLRTVPGMAKRGRMRRGVRGFSLVTGIFLLVVMAALGTFMVVFTGLQVNTVQNDILGVRAYYAARAGIDWALYRALDPDSPVSPPPWPPLPFAACPAGNIALGSLGGSLASFSVTIVCNLTDAKEANRFIRIYEITATACNQASCVVAPAVPPSGYVERQVVVTVARCLDPTTPTRYRCEA